MAGADPTSSERRDAGVSIIRTLRDAGFAACFAGGCVRDELLGLHPKDYDVATDAKPPQVRALFRRVNEVGASFGVMLVRVRGVTVEVATFRREGGYTDRRRPDHVEYAQMEDDARRRDFTINALYLDPLSPPETDRPEVHGHVIDLVGGLRDLEAGTIRAVGDPEARLSEDDLRALRAVRFAARLGFTIEERTVEAIRRHAGELVGVSRERIGDELRAMLAHPSRATAAHLMESLGLARPALDCRSDSPERRDDPLLEGLEPDADFVTGLAAWAIDRMDGGVFDPGAIRAQAGAMTSRLRRALCLSNEERDALRQSLETLSRIVLDWGALPVAGRKRLAVTSRFPAAVSILRAAEAALAESIERDVADLARTPTGLNPPALVLGDDLIAMGLTPGPEFRSILDAVYDRQLEGEVVDRAGAEAAVRRLIGG
ncbi:MAG: CCA tRNA nucleotidyltransferase [Phycisphaeraceae bacterium]|nr:CCA tRNA nucleotidyltransferase [Phycisphaeraceae bacterium]MCB9848665.1 CCA tRNA nucleotidyltransferase [Phycisphaeraceae bacterium]